MIMLQYFVKYVIYFNTNLMLLKRIEKVYEEETIFGESMKDRFFKIKRKRDRGRQKKRKKKIEKEKVTDRQTESEQTESQCSDIQCHSVPI